MGQYDFVFGQSATAATRDANTQTFCAIVCASRWLPSPPKFMTAQTARPHSCRLQLSGAVKDCEALLTLPCSDRRL